jgi:hypothetical protein
MSNRSRRIAWKHFGAFVVVATLGSFAASTNASAAEPFRFPEAKHGKGEMRYINGLPVLTVAGPPEEMGEQIGVLALKPARAILDTVREFLKERGLERVPPPVSLAANALFSQFPEECRRETEAMVKAAGIDRDLVILANTIMDLRGVGGCSGLLVATERSATGGPLYGRNFDFPPVGRLPEFSLVVVYRPAGKQAFALVTFPGALAAGAGMTESGLALGSNVVRQAADGSEPFNPKGIPGAIASRRVLAECRTVDDVEQWFRKHALTAMWIIPGCDRRRQAVFELTTTTVAVRGPVDGICCCTNHFRAKDLAVELDSPRFDALEKSRSQKRLGVADVARYLHAANQGRRTLQTMVFEPATLKLHLSIGEGPASARPLKTLELGPLLWPK